MARTPADRIVDPLPERGTDSTGLFETTMSITQKYKEKEGDSPEEPQESSELESAAPSPETAPSGESSAPAVVAKPTGTGARAVDDKPVLAEAAGEEEEYEEEDDDAAAGQFGTTRFVYAAYFAGGIAVAFLVSKLLGALWLKLSQYKPVVGEPQQEVVMPLSALAGVAVAVYYWKRTRARQLAEEVADELSKVTWPSKQEVTNGTAVVLVTTAVATIFFALMDRFWGFVTNLVYGS